MENYDSQYNNWWFNLTKSLFPTNLSLYGVQVDSVSAGGGPLQRNVPTAYYWVNPIRIPKSMIGLPLNTRKVGFLDHNSSVSFDSLLTTRFYRIDRRYYSRHARIIFLSWHSYRELKLNLNLERELTSFRNSEPFYWFSVLGIFIWNGAHANCFD